MRYFELLIHLLCIGLLTVLAVALAGRALYPVPDIEKLFSKGG